MPNFHIHVVTLLPRDNNERLLALSGASDENISILENQLDVSIGGNGFDLKILFKKEFNKEYYQEKHFTSTYQEHAQYVEKIITNLYAQTLVNGRVNYLGYASVMAAIRTAHELQELEFLKTQELRRVEEAQASNSSPTSSISNSNSASSISMSKAPTAADAIALIEAERKKRTSQNKSSSPFATFDTPVTIPKDEPDRPDREERRALREEAQRKREEEQRKKEQAFNLDAQLLNDFASFQASGQASTLASTQTTSQAIDIEEITLPAKEEGAPNPGFSLEDDKALGEDLFEPLDTNTFTTRDFSDIDLFAEDDGKGSFAQSLDNLDLFGSFLENEEKSEAVFKPQDIEEAEKTELKEGSSLNSLSLTAKESTAPYDDLAPKAHKVVRELPPELAKELGWSEKEASTSATEDTSLQALGIEEYIRRLSDEELDGNPEDELALETFSDHKELIERIEQTVQDFASEGKGYGFIMDALERMYRKDQVELFEEYQRTVVDYRDLLNLERDRRDEAKEVAAKAAKEQEAKELTEAKRQEASSFWSQQKAKTLSPADKVAKAREILNKQKQKSEAQNEVKTKTKAQELAELAEGGGCGSGCGCGGHDHGRPVLNYPKKPQSIQEPGVASNAKSSESGRKKVLSPFSIPAKTALFVNLDKEQNSAQTSSASENTHGQESARSRKGEASLAEDLAKSTLAFSREAEQKAKVEAEANTVYGQEISEAELLQSLANSANNSNNSNNINNSNNKEAPAEGRVATIPAPVLLDDVQKPASLASGKVTLGVAIKPRGPKVISGIVTNDDDDKDTIAKSKLQTPLTTPMSKGQLRQKEKYLEHNGEFTKIGRGKITPQTINQQLLVNNINDNDITFALGPAGCGKSFIAVAMAVDALLENRVRRIILTRPAVEAGEKLGFLPGDIAQKLDPYLKPLYDAMVDILGAEKVSTLLEKGIVEIAPLAFMRGRTLSNAYIILDEAQNTTVEQMKMFLTRLGFDSKMVVTGDTSQIDLAKNIKSGIVHAQEVLDNIPGVSFSYLYSKDVVRHHTVTKVVEAYEHYEALNQQKAELAKKPRLSKEQMINEVLSTLNTQDSSDDNNHLNHNKEEA